jgi:tRNA (cytidine/uridine-2'-O-)-methyltransferase
MPLNIALFEPEIPPNTGNIIRLCANTGAILHLIQPLGFSLDDKHLQRAGLDYHELARIKLHKNFMVFKEAVQPTRILALSTKGKNIYANTKFSHHDTLLFGPETRGLPSFILSELESDHILKIPMLPNNRSLNLSNAVAIVLYEAWKQLKFTGF